MCLTTLQTLSRLAQACHENRVVFHTLCPLCLSVSLSLIVDATTSATDSTATAGTQETPSPTASTAAAGGLLAVPPLPARPAWRGTASRTTRTKGKSATHRVIGQPDDSSKPKQVAQQVQASSGQLWLCSFVRLANSLPHALHTGDGKKTTEGTHPCVRSTHAKKTRLVEFTRNCTAMTTAFRKHPSCPLLREYLLLSQRPISSMRKPNGRSMPRHESATTSPRRRPQVTRRWILSRVHRNPTGSPPEDGSNSRHRRKDFAHIHHPHPLCDAPTPAVLCLFLSTGRIPLFPDRTHERRQFFQLVRRMEWHLPRLARLIVTGSHANRASPR